MALFRLITDEHEISDCFNELKVSLEKNALCAGRKGFLLHGRRRRPVAFEYSLSGRDENLVVACLKEKPEYYLLAHFVNSEGTLSTSTGFQLALPRSGIDRQYPCAFATDTAGAKYLVHRGLFFGGKLTMKKDYFFDHYEGCTADADDGEIISKVAVLGELSSRGFVEWFAFFLNEIERISVGKPKSHAKRHKFDRKRRADNRATVKAAIKELNRRLGRAKAISGNGFGLYQPRQSENATATLEFEYKDETLVLEPTLCRDKINVILYPRASMRGRAALAEFVQKGFGREIESLSKGEIGFEFNGRTVWYDVSLKGSKARKKELFVEYADMAAEAVVKTLRKTRH